MEFMELIKTPRVDNVVLWQPLYQKKLTGTLCLTSHHIIFVDRLNEKDELMILYLSIEHMERKFTGTNGILIIFCKNFTNFKLKIPGQEEATHVAASIDALSTIDSAGLYYPFYMKRVNFTILQNGWELFNLQDENRKLIKDSDSWRVCTVNARNEVCGTYPVEVIVPAAATDDTVKRCSKFRQSGRFPVLSYLHTNKVPLMRSSQPCCGQNNKRCKDDEKLLSYALVGHTVKGCIVDTRSNSVATSQKNKGGGYETDQHYPQWRRTFYNVGHASFLSDSIAQLYEACTDKKLSSWLLKLDASGWMTGVENLLNASVKTVEHVDKSASPTLVHDGDGGVDCTLQVTSLAQLCLNPECRTILGFEALITREWLWFGHPFTERHGKVGISPHKRKGHSPVFLMFLDCVHQIVHQYPISFEFNEQFLLLLAEHSYASEYGTFLFNNEWQREQSHVKDKTTSLWSYTNRDEVYRSIKNPLYERNEKVLYPSAAPLSLEVWTNLFMKADITPQQIQAYENIQDEMWNVKNENTALKQKIEELYLEFERLRTNVLDQIAVSSGNQDTDSPHHKPDT